MPEQRLPAADFLRGDADDLGVILLVLLAGELNVDEALGVLLGIAIEDLLWDGRPFHDLGLAGEDGDLLLVLSGFEVGGDAAGPRDVRQLGLVRPAEDNDGAVRPQKPA